MSRQNPASPAPQHLVRAPGAGDREARAAGASKADRAAAYPPAFRDTHFRGVRRGFDRRRAGDFRGDAFPAERTSRRRTARGGHHDQPAAGASGHTAESERRGRRGGSAGVSQAQFAQSPREYPGRRGEHGLSGAPAETEVRREGRGVQHERGRDERGSQLLRRGGERQQQRDGGGAERPGGGAAERGGLHQHERQRERERRRTGGVRAAEEGREARKDRQRHRR